MLIQLSLLNSIALSEKLLRSEIKGILPKTQKDRLFCTITPSKRTEKLEILVYKKSGSTYTDFNKYFKLKKTSSSNRKALTRYRSNAIKKCAQIKNKLLIQQPVDTTTPTPTPTQTPIITATPTIAPTFRLASSTNAESTKRIQSETVSMSSAVVVECSGCNENFSLTVRNFNESLIEKADISDNSIIESGSVHHDTSNLSAMIVADLKPYFVGTGEVSLSAIYKGEEFSVSGSVSFSTQSDSITYPDGLFVSPSRGLNDPSQPGSSEAPLAGFSEAMNRALNRLYSASGPPLNIVILLDDGVHLVDSTISINQSRIREMDSLTIMPWDNAKPVLFMGREVPANSWSKDGLGRWVSCTLGSAINDSNFLPSALYRNLEPLVPARFPNTGMLTTVPIYENDGVTKKNDRFTFNENGLPSISSGTAIQATFVDQYVSYKSTASITGKTVTITNPDYYNKFYSRNNERHEFYIEGPKEFIDGQIVSAAGDGAYEFAQEGGCLYHNHPLFDPQIDTIRYSLPSHSGLIRIYEGRTNSGGINIYGVQLAGGSLAKHSGTSGPNFGNPTSNHALLIFEAASNIRLQDSFMGPSGMAGIIGYRDVTNISVARTLFKNLTGPSISIIGYDFRPEASAHTIMIEDSVFVHPNPASLMNRGINLGYVGNTIVRNNYFKDLYQASISVAGLRYYYLGLTWCQRVECPRILGKSSCTQSEQTRVCQCDPNDATNGGTCINNGSNVRKMSWDDAQEYNPTRNVVIQGNFVEGGLAPVNDAGLIYIWGIPYGDSDSSQACEEDPIGCKSTTNVSVTDNITLNSKSMSGANHFVHLYGDDGANSTDFRRNIAINPQGSAILLFAKGQGGTIEDNLLIGSEKSSHAMLNFAEFQATSKPNAAPFLTLNKEFNRLKTIHRNTFIQVPSTDSTSFDERGSIMFFSNWDPATDDGYGNVLSSSTENIFAETMYGKSSRKSIFLRPPESDELHLDINQWSAYTFSNGRKFDTDATQLDDLELPSREQILLGRIPSHPSLSTALSVLPRTAGVSHWIDRYDDQVEISRKNFEVKDSTSLSDYSY